MVLNLTNSLPFFGIFLVVFVWLGGWFLFPFAFSVALGGTWALRKYGVTSKRLAPPSNGAVLVTGCSTGIGEDLVLRLAKSGVLVFAGVRKAEDGEKLKKTLGAAAQSNVVPIVLDVTNSQHIEDSVATVEKELKSNGKELFAVVNNAGYGDSAPLELIALDKLRAQYECNVFGLVAVSQAFLPLLRRAKVSQSKRLILISSAVGIINVPGTGPYQSTKHAVESIGDTWRMELSKWNIDVVLVEPGFITTNFGATARANRATNIETASKGAESKRCGEEVIAAYQTSAAKAAAKVNPSSPVTVVTDTLEASLFDSAPLTRYRSGNDSVYAVWLVSHLPDKLADLILRGPF